MFYECVILSLNFSCTLVDLGLGWVREWEREAQGGRRVGREGESRTEEC